MEEKFTGNLEEKASIYARSGMERFEIFKSLFLGPRRDDRVEQEVMEVFYCNGRFSEGR